MSATDGVVIVGCGGAGASAAATLRAIGYAGQMAVVCGEDVPPYDRTMLNKAVLPGLVGPQQITLPAAATPNVRWLGSDRAVALDADARYVALSSGARLTYDWLVIASGARPREWPGMAEGGARNLIVQLRSLDDTIKLQGLIAEAPAGHARDLAGVTILGAGLLGSELASVLHGMHLPVALVSADRLPMANRVGETVARWLVEQHSSRVNTLFGCTAAEAQLDATGRLLVTMSDGRSNTSEAMVVCIGVQPDIGWLAGSALNLSDGVVVDSRLRALGAERVFGVGDLARVVNPQGRGRRVEHWANAVAQGRHAAHCIAHALGVLPDDPGPFLHTPTYTTAVYGTKMTMIGAPTSPVRECLTHGDPRSGSFTVVLGDEQDKTVGAVGVGTALLARQLADFVEREEAVDITLASLAVLTSR